MAPSSRELQSERSPESVIWLSTISSVVVLFIVYCLLSIVYCLLFIAYGVDSKKIEFSLISMKGTILVYITFIQQI